MCWRGCLFAVRCTWPVYSPTDATATPSSLASLKSRMVLPFWCWITQVVLEKRPLNGCLLVSSRAELLGIIGTGFCGPYVVRVTQLKHWPQPLAFLRPQLDCDASYMPAARWKHVSTTYTSAEMIPELIWSVRSTTIKLNRSWRSYCFCSGRRQAPNNSKPSL